jgi:hypothetical protein
MVARNIDQRPCSVTGAVCPVNPAFVATGGAPHWEALGDVALKMGWGI